MYLVMGSPYVSERPQFSRPLHSLRQDMSWVEGVTLLSSEEHNVIALWRDS